MASFTEAALRQWQEKTPTLLAICREVGMEQNGTASPFYRAIGTRSLDGLATHMAAEILVEPANLYAVRLGTVLFASLNIAIEQKGTPMNHKLLCRSLGPNEHALEVVTKGFNDDMSSHAQLSSAESVDLFAERYGASLRWFVSETFPDSPPY